MLRFVLLSVLLSQTVSLVNRLPVAPRVQFQPSPLSTRVTAPSRSALAAATVGDAATYRAFVDSVDVAPKSFAVPRPRAPTYKSTSRKRVAVLVCPAQLCVESDYKMLFDNLSLHSDDLNVEIADSSGAAPICRKSWMGVAKNLHTKEFFQGNLSVQTTLKQYFQAIETGLARIFDAEGPDCNICIVGHSIGGWVARAYLGGLGQQMGHSSEIHRLALQRCSSYITLGTPHVAPEDAPIDQTRGLIKTIDETPSCSPEFLASHGIDITCVCSRAITSEVTSKGVEGVLAAHSYMPMTGFREDVEGDGIVPLEMAFLDKPAKQVVLDKCSLTGKGIRHSHVVPTPWNLWDPKASSMHLPPHDYPSYVSRGVVIQWAHHIR